jgi:CheY-like chemotaxis protein
MIKKYILVGEDDVFYMNIYRVKLTKLGYDVTIVDDGAKVLEEAKKRKPDMFLLDMIMPVMDGFATIKALRAIPDYKNTPIIIMSSLSQEEDRQKALELGANDYWVKANHPISEVGDKIQALIQ